MIKIDKIKIKDSNPIKFLEEKYITLILLFFCNSILFSIPIFFSPAIRINNIFLIISTSHFLSSKLMCPPREVRQKKEEKSSLRKGERLPLISSALNFVMI